MALVGAALGGVLGLVPSEHQLGRFLGFAAGFLLAWAGFAVRAAALPDSTTGRAIACLGVLLLLAVVAGVSGGRIPLWSMLLGAAAIAAAYETTYTGAPARFLIDSPQAATTVLVAASVGVLATTLAQLVGRGERARTPDRPADTTQPHPDAHPHDRLTVDDALGGRA
ncbi:hypothetical protein [Mariniluteicoccus flavus]